MTRHGDPEVLRAHPRLVRHALAQASGGRYVYEHLFAPTPVERDDDDVEDLDALPFGEQVAVMCSLASCSGPSRGAPVDASVRFSAAIAACLVRGRKGDPMTWAEAEARIRNGEVSP